ncbi:hypothetical protein F5Y03DRAFT_396306 [Xylaria venustula]|nr:hypothetical protein F5Y03DRAFT_396306 [Xylaria venustula]
METAVDRPVKEDPEAGPDCEPELESETSTRAGTVKPEIQDEPSVFSLPSREVAEARPESQPGSSERPGDAEPNDPDYLGRLCEYESPETLEAAVSVATNLLGQLQDTLSTYESPETEQWIKAVVGLQERTAPSRTVVGVVGNTGAGKSSVINALLDEERLLPTNCLRACTASPTEISYNYSNDPRELYKANVEFISSHEWLRELQVLYTDLLDGNGQISREATNSDSDAGVAYAKVKAVYPHMTKEMLANAEPEDLANNPAVRGILGTTKTLTKQTAKELYEGLQRFVDSKEKPTDAIGKKGKADTTRMEYWPLIRVVQIFTKAKALSTGAVIVDLPGVQDSNAARAAVAANYMKACTGLWIVAPITRAVDDKTAKSLLGESFKRQLKYDGTYSAVSFICSKTDDISNMEAALSLGLEAEFTESWSNVKEMEKVEQSLKSQISILEKDKLALGEQYESCENEEDVWDDLQNRITNGETVYAPFNPKKRPRSEIPLGSRKNLRSDVDDDMHASYSGSSDKENSISEQSRTPLTGENIEEKISSLRALRRKLRTEKQSLQSKITGLKQEIQRTKAEQKTVRADVTATCIQGRNDYARSAIKRDFAMGIKELDQENAVEEDDETFDPDEDHRNYDEVAHSLPVFCVSSRAYQKLTGKLEKDDFQAHGFLSIEETEIPKLQEHAKKLTEARRVSHCRQFLNDLSQLVNSMKLWSADGDDASNLTDSEKTQEEKHLKKLLGHLEEEIELSLKRSIDLIRSAINEQIFENISTSMPLAIEAAPDTAYSWGAPRGEGGLFWATYKATCRRQGVYCGAAGPRDFNQELFDPISRNLATGWERAFQRRIPSILNVFAKEVADKLRHFHQTAKARAEQRRINATGVITLSSQIQTHIRTVESIPEIARQKITELQRDASRQFTPTITQAMNNAYTTCTNEYGPGSYARMKESMADHVETARHSMFNDATEVVKEALQEMCRSVMEDVSQSIDAVFNTVCAEYMRTLVGTELGRTGESTPEELEIRSRIYKILLTSDKMFAPVLGEIASEAYSGTAANNIEALGANPTETEKNLHSMVDLMQADIRDQDLAGGEEDPFVSDADEEFRDIADIVKEELHA